MALSDLLAGVYAIVDESGMATHGRTLSDIARAVLDGGARVVQLRAKNLGARELLAEAARIRRLTADAGAAFILNDRLDLALLADADGVHLGQDDFPLTVARRVVGYKLLIGISTHDLEQARQAVAGEADYIGFGPIYRPMSKDSPYEPLGLDALREVAREVDVPVVAIGGLTPDRFGEVLEAGATSGAFVSAVSAARDPRAATEALIRIHQERTSLLVDG